MPAKKTRQSDKAVYLLSANHKVRRVSLKKISERAKSTRRPKRLRAVAKATAAEPSLPVHQHLAPAKVASVAIAAASLFLVVTLVAASWSSSASAVDTTAAAERPDAPTVLTADMSSAPVIAVAAPTLRVTKAPAESNESPVPALVKPTTTTASRPTETAKPRVEVAPAPLLAAQSLASADPQPVAAEPSVDTVTISGCLDFDGKSAWLKNTSGIDAPKTRSWRSGFFKKSAPRIALVDGPASVEAYDGRQVSVTGVLVDREMHVSSLRPTADNCD